MHNFFEVGKAEYPDMFIVLCTWIHIQFIPVVLGTRTGETLQRALTATETSRKRTNLGTKEMDLKHS